MKKLSYYMLISVALLGVSCVKDRSTFNTRKITPIVIDTTGLKAQLIQYQFDTLQLMPKVTQEGMDSGRLKYQWTIDAYGGYERVVGTTRRLSTAIIENPDPTPYTLILRVTDTTTNLKSVLTWSLQVISPFGQGLIVADTKDGTTSDANLIMAFNFTSGLPTDSATTRIFQNAYSRANGNQKLDGLVKQVNYMRYNSTKDITFLTDHSFVRINPNSYQLTGKDNDLFVLAPGVIQPNEIQTAIKTNQHQYIINNGKAYGRYGETRQFGYSFLAPDALGYSCQKICGLQDPVYYLKTAGALYDEKNNRFLLLPRMVLMSNPLMSFSPTDFSDPAPAFDPNNMGNKTCLQMIEGYDQRIIAIMKTRDQDQFFVYQIKLTDPLNGKMGIMANDLSNSPEIAQAKFYTCSNAEQVLFYATENHVYATTLELGSPSTTMLRYTTGNGEKITGMKMYTGGGSMYLPNPNAPSDWSQRMVFSSANRLLLLSTYNDATKEGKIIAIPLEILGIGGLVTNPDYIRTYSGFGKITAFSLQSL
ncbi:PKD-like family lipoprotein [Chitinophaga eiseniae]|uniref:PKD-like family protein n=1 Tax=Chitinophaga eiseniae TaxID=634771 RepID=A0A847SUX4_9BACT|nr:PKD-like family lipoprotein [Chitinophaga eiseniae]NLR80432.1 hypothetical protein [Chitinophaga eiseniae]